MTRGILFFALCLIAISCVEPFNFKPGDIPDFVVVYGRISDGPGPHTVKITHGISLDTKRIPKGIADAKVVVSDDAGSSEQLVSIGDGIYQTTSLVGVTGRSYKVNIVTKEGEEYESELETMLPVGSFDARAEFLLAVDSLDTVRRPYQNGFNIIVNSQLDPAQNNQVRWRWSGTFQYETDPLSAGYYVGTKTFVPNPPPCTKYFAYFRNPGWILAPIGGPGADVTCECCTCWHTTHGEEMLISDEDAVENNTIHDRLLTFLPVGFLYFQVQFVMVVEQESINPSAYRFFKRAKKSNDTGSDLFQTVPPRTVGNISAKIPGREIVGLFSVGSTKRDTIRLYRSDVPYTIDPPAPYSTLRCQEYFSTETTNVQPPWY